MDVSLIRQRYLSALEAGKSVEDATAIANGIAKPFRAKVELPPPPTGLAGKIGAGGAAHPLDHDWDGKAGGSQAPATDGDLPALRAEYQKIVGKRAFPGWDAVELRRRMAEATA